MGPLVPLLAVLIAPPAVAASSDCVKAWQPAVQQAVWEVPADRWGALCEQLGTAEKALDAAKAAFERDCFARAMPAIQQRSLDPKAVKSLCAQGVPGRDRIPRDRPIPGPEGQRRQQAAFRQAGRNVTGLSQGVGSLIAAGDIGGIYGERAGGGGGAVVAGRPVGARPAAAAAGPAPPGVRLDEPRAPVPVARSPQAQRALDIGVIQKRIVTSGVAAPVARQAGRVIGEMLREADPTVVRNLVTQNVQVYIIPKDKKLTDIGPFKDLRGKKTFDGRPWEGVRGVANQALPGGGWALAVAEESLTDSKSGYPKNFVLAHEFGHMVQNHGLPTWPSPPPPPPSFLGRVSSAFQVLAGGLLPKTTGPRDRVLSLARVAYATNPMPPSFEESYRDYVAEERRAGKSGLGSYADANKNEFFAQLTAAYFDLEYDEHGKTHDLKDLLRRRPELAQFMYRVYGPARSLEGF